MLQAEAALTSIQWQKTKVELGEAVERMKRGYWARHSMQEAGDESEASALEVIKSPLLVGPV